MSNKERATLDFKIILEENRYMDGKKGTVFFASINKWTSAMLSERLQYPAMFSSNPVNHKTYGIGYPVFVPN